MFRYSSVTVTAPAKINLLLHVGPAREDGYHDLATVYQAVDLIDELTLSLTDTQPGCSQLSITGQGADKVPTDYTNLAVKAVDLLLEDTDLLPGYSISISKKIPVAGGMAGGSADAAAALVAANHLFGLGHDVATLETYAAKLGSDIPFLLHGHTMIGSGRGEQLTPLIHADTTLHWAVAVHDEGLSTPAVYTEFDRLAQQEGREGFVAGSVSAESTILTDFIRTLGTGSLTDIAAALDNNLQPASLSLMPNLARTLEAGRNASALAAMVSGSGPTCLFLCTDGQHAQEVADELSATGTCTSVRCASGPVAGVTIVNSTTSDRIV